MQKLIKAHSYSVLYIKTAFSGWYIMRGGFRRALLPEGKGTVKRESAIGAPPNNALQNVQCKPKLLQLFSNFIIISAVSSKILIGYLSRTSLCSLLLSHSYFCAYFHCEYSSLSSRIASVDFDKTIK